MKKTTRKSFSRKAIVVVMSVFLTVSLTAVGFASWLISKDGGATGSGNVNVSDVSDEILGVEITDSANLGNIHFGPLESDGSGNIRFDDKKPTEKESLTITVKGSIQRFKTLSQMEVKIKVPAGVIAAAGYGLKADSTTEYEIKPDLPKYITLPAGAADENGNLIDTSKKVEYLATNSEVFKENTADNTAEFTFTIEFGWGELFGNKNPGRYLDGEDGLTVSPENKDALLAIANADKASSSQYTELTAEAKRDILNKMKTVIGTDESSKYTVVIDAKAK